MRHGLGLWPNMAAWTGLADRGREAGLATVLPEAWHEMWDDNGLGWRFSMTLVRYGDLVL